MARAANLTDRFAVARAVADARLYEGYVLYPYRASAQKNQVRWQFGVLAPPAWAAADPSESCVARTECLLAPGSRPSLAVRVRCLQVQHRSIEAVGDGADLPPTLVPWDEAIEARAADPRAAAVVDRVEAMSPALWDRLHGEVRPVDTPPGGPPDVPWWDPGVDASVDPDTDSVRVGDVDVAKGSRVRLRPTRRADAQDLFLADQEAIVPAVFRDVDGGDHIAVILAADPNADLAEAQGRYLYFAPNEVEPLDERRTTT